MYQGNLRLAGIPGVFNCGRRVASRPRLAPPLPAPSRRAMVLTQTQLNSVKTYNLSSVGKALPIWARKGATKSKKVKQQEDEQIEVIQDLYFPAACNRVKVSRDGETLMATGSYPPQVAPPPLALLPCLSPGRCHPDAATRMLLPGRCHRDCCHRECCDPKCCHPDAARIACSPPWTFSHLPPSRTSPPLFETKGGGDAAFCLKKWRLLHLLSRKVASPPPFCTAPTPPLALRGSRREFSSHCHLFIVTFAPIRHSSCAGASLRAARALTQV